MSVTPETVAKDTAAIRERVLGLHHVLAHSTKLSVMECIWLWKSILKKAINHLGALPILTADESRAILEQVVEFEEQMEGSFVLIAAKKPEADQLRVLTWKVSPWVRPFVLELAVDAKLWSGTLEKKSPQETHDAVHAFAARLEEGFNKAVAAYA